MPYRRILYGTHVSYILPFAFVRARISTYKGTPAQQKMPQILGDGGQPRSNRDGRCVHGDTLMASRRKKNLSKSRDLGGYFIFFNLRPL